MTIDCQYRRIRSLTAAILTATGPESNVIKDNFMEDN